MNFDAWKSAPYDDDRYGPHQSDGTGDPIEAPPQDTQPSQRVLDELALGLALGNFVAAVCYGPKG